MSKESVDKIYGYDENGKPVYNNAPSVSCVMLTRKVDGYKEVLVVRRGRNPGKGLLGLPGGFQMRGETWQQAGIREVWEETGIVIPRVHFYDVDTDEDGHNVFISIFNTDMLSTPLTFDPNPEEVEELIWINGYNWHELSDQWAFKMHMDASYDMVWE